MSRRHDHDLDALERSDRTAREWVDTVARELGTEDPNQAYRVLRAWLHAVRDRLTVDVAAHAAAQLPLLLRGVFYDGWTPSRVPGRYDADEFCTRIARDTGISLGEARDAAPAVTAALALRCSPGQVDHLLAQLPTGLRTLLTPVGEVEPSDIAADVRAAVVPARGPARRIDEVEQQLDTLVDAVRALVRGLEELPVDEPRPERVAAAARRAHQILLALAG